MAGPGGETSESGTAPFTVVYAFAGPSRHCDMGEGVHAFWSSAMIPLAVLLAACVCEFGAQAIGLTLANQTLAWMPHAKTILCECARRCNFIIYSLIGKSPVKYLSDCSNFEICLLDL